MKTAIGILAFLLLLALPLRAQLTLSSYDRAQPFIFCGNIPQGDRLSVPFDIANNTTAAITIDSAVAAGDTADFYSNRVVATDEPYLNPLLWKTLDNVVIEAGGSFFSEFYFTPKTPGAKQLTITLYYHDASGSPLTAQSTVRFHSIDAVAGLGFLHATIDTVHYGDNLSSMAVTYDRTLVMDTLTLRDTVAIGDTLRAALTGDDRIDLTSCGGVTITSIAVQQESSDDIFRLLSPTAPVTIPSGGSSLVDFMYVPLSKETIGRQAYITFTTSENLHATLHLIIVAPEKSGVEDEAPAHDERGVITIARQSIATIPNPVTGNATIRVGVAQGGHARVSLVNSLGEEVAHLLDERLETGMRDIPFDASALPSGIYFARFDQGGRILTERVVVEK